MTTFKTPSKPLKLFKKVKILTIKFYLQKLYGMYLLIFMDKPPKTFNRFEIIFENFGHPRKFWLFKKILSWIVKRTIKTNHPGHN